MFTTPYIPHIIGGGATEQGELNMARKHKQDIEKQLAKDPESIAFTCKGPREFWPLEDRETRKRVKEAGRKAKAQSTANG